MGRDAHTTDVFLHDTDRMYFGLRKQGAVNLGRGHTFHGNQRNSAAVFGTLRGMYRHTGHFANFVGPVALQVMQPFKFTRTAYAIMEINGRPDRHHHRQT